MDRYLLVGYAQHVRHRIQGVREGRWPAPWCNLCADRRLRAFLSKV